MLLGLSTKERFCYQNLLQRNGQNSGSTCTVPWITSQFTIELCYEATHFHSTVQVFFAAGANTVLPASHTGSKQQPKGLAWTNSRTDTMLSTISENLKSKEKSSKAASSQWPLYDPKCFGQSVRCLHKDHLFQKCIKTP